MWFTGQESFMVMIPSTFLIKVDGSIPHYKLLGPKPSKWVKISENMSFRPFGGLLGPKMSPNGTKWRSKSFYGVRTRPL